MVEESLSTPLSSSFGSIWNGISHPPAKTAPLNGVAERSVKTLKNRGKDLVDS